MRINVVKRVIGSLLIGVQLLCLCSCGERQVSIEPMEQEDVYTFSFDCLGGTDVMPISGFWGPSAAGYSVDGQSLPDYYSDEIFQLLAECGINLFTYSSTDYVKYPNQVIQMLELGEKYNIGITVTDTLISTPREDEAISLEEMAARITKYSNYTSFAGVYVRDEPGSLTFKPSPDGSGNISAYAPIFQNLSKLDIWGYGSLYPVWMETDYDGYNKMVEEYCETCDPMMLCFDHYPWDGIRTKESFFYNMDVIRRYANKYEIPFWSFVQAGGQFNDAKEYFDSKELFPSEGEIQWSANVALVCGAKGIAYFPMIQPYHFAFAETDRMDFQRNGLLGAWGNKTQWWYYAQNLNKQIAAVDEVLMNAVNKGVIASGEDAKKITDGLEMVIKEDTWREVESVEGSALVGCFNYRGKSALYVMNYEDAYAQNITLNLRDVYNLDIVQNAEHSIVSTDVVELDLKAGEGVLIVFE